MATVKKKSIRRIAGLITSKKQIPHINEGIADYKYDEINSHQNPTTANFSDLGKLEFYNRTPQGRRFPAHEGFLSHLVSITTGAGARLVEAQGIAPVYNMGASLYVWMKGWLNTQLLSDGDQNYPQCDSIDKRLSVDRGKMESQAEWRLLETSFVSRKKQICSDGVGYKYQTVPRAPFKTIATANGYPAITGLGFGATNTVTGTAATNTITFEDGATVDSLPNPLPLAVGQRISVPWSATSAKIYTILTVTSTDTKTGNVTVAENIAANIAAVVINPSVYAPDTEILQNYKFHVMIKPNLGCFKTKSHLPYGEWKLEVLPSRNYKRRAVETIFESTPGSAGQYDVLVDHVRWVCPSYAAENLGPVKFFLDMKEIKMSTQPITSESFDYTFRLSQNTRAITIALQDTRSDSETSTMWPSITKFRTQDDTHLQMTKLQIRWAGQTRPMWDPALEYASGVNQLMQMYRMCYLYSGLEFGKDGPETFQEWLNNGPIFHFPWLRSGNDDRNECNVKISFSGTAPTNAVVCLFEHQNNIGEINAKNSTEIKVLVSGNNATRA